MNDFVKGIEGHFTEMLFPVLLLKNIGPYTELFIKVTHTHDATLMRLVMNFCNQHFVLAVEHGAEMRFPSSGSNNIATAVFDPLEWTITYTWPQPETGDDHPPFIVDPEITHVAHHTGGAGVIIDEGTEKSVKIINNGPFYLDFGDVLMGRTPEDFFENNDLMDDPDQHDMLIDEFVYIYSLPPTERGDNLTSCLKTAGDVPNQLFAFKGVFYSLGEIWRHPEAAAAARALVPEDTVDIMKRSQANDLK